MRFNYRCVEGQFIWKPGRTQILQCLLKESQALGSAHPGGRRKRESWGRVSSAPIRVVSVPLANFVVCLAILPALVPDSAFLRELGSRPVQPQCQCSTALPLVCHTGLSSKLSQGVRIKIWRWPDGVVVTPVFLCRDNADTSMLLVLLGPGFLPSLVFFVPVPNEVFNSFLGQRENSYCLSVSLLPQLDPAVVVHYLQQFT